MGHWGGQENVVQMKGKQEVWGCMGGVGAVKPHYVVRVDSILKCGTELCDANMVETCQCESSQGATQMHLKLPCFTCNYYSSFLLMSGINKSYMHD